MEKKRLSSLLWIILLDSFVGTVHCDCGPPLNIPYAKIKPEFEDLMTFAVGSTVKYDCGAGLIRAPGAKNFITCLGNSKWSSHDEFCRLRSCGFPGEIENGYIEAKDFLFGSRVTYHCVQGFHMTSKRNYRECQVDGTWSNSLPDCEALMCPPPPVIPNGTFYPVKEEYNFLDAVKYECLNPNMVMEYDSSVFCMDDGNWSDPMPSCIEVNCEPPDVPHSRKLSGFVGPYTLNAMIRFDCNKGFTMEGSDSIVCTMNSKWEPLPPECIGAFCPEPRLLNGRVIQGKKTDGYSAYDTITLDCGVNYKLNGASKITCGRDLQWNPKLPTCELQSFCTEPKLVNGEITHGKTTNKYYKYDAVMVACNGGYKLKGARRLTCGTNLQWSDTPICELEDGCSSPQIYNGRITLKNSMAYNPEIDGHGFSTSDEIEIMCNDGYRLQGSAQSECISKKTWLFFSTYEWSPKLPTCERIKKQVNYEYWD